MMNISYNTGAFRNDDFELMCKTFNRLGLNSVELHLAHFIEVPDGLSPSRASRLMERHKIHSSIASGGWCDLAKDEVGMLPAQIELIRALGISRIRLFLTPHPYKVIGETGIGKIHDHITILASAYPDITFLFETHHGVGVELDCLTSIMLSAPPNVGVVFDPINLIAAKTNVVTAMETLHPFIRHVHLKGAIVHDSTVIYFPFGDGTVDLTGIIRPLSEITDSFSIEHEGKGCPILGLLRAKENLEKITCEF